MLLPINVNLSDDNWYYEKIEAILAHAMNHTEGQPGCRALTKHKSGFCPKHYQPINRMYDK